MTRSRLPLLLGFFLLLAGVAPATAAAPAELVVSHGPRTSARVALTFDDGVSPANCRRILATLVARHVPATFFPIADAMRADPAFWRMVVAVGDPIGDHTVTHPEMPTLTADQQYAQINEARAIAEKISGAPMLRVFRPPYGAYNSATLKAAAQAGFPTVLLWDTSDRDTSPHGSLVHMLGAAEAATNGSVILMHCGPDATPYLLGPLLDHLEAAGLRPVTVPELLGLRWTEAPAASPPTPSQILDGLSTLPPVPSGGVIVGPSGIGGMTFPPAPPSPSAAASAAPSAAAPSAAAPSASPAASPSGSAAAPSLGASLGFAQSPGAASPASTLVAVVASRASQSSVAAAPVEAAAADESSALILLALGGCVLAVMILGLGLLRARRR